MISAKALAACRAAERVVLAVSTEFC